MGDLPGMGEYGFEDVEAQPGLPRMPELATPANKTPQPVQRPGQKGKNVQLESNTQATAVQEPRWLDCDEAQHETGYERVLREEREELATSCRFASCCEDHWKCRKCEDHSAKIDDRELSGMQAERSERTLAFLIEEQKRVVCNARRHYADRKAEVTALRQAWQLSNRLLLESEADAKSEMDAAERTLRGLTVEAYQLTGSKAPARGVGVRLVTKLRYDAKAALDWAKQRGMFLALDVPAFETFARNIPGEVPFVETTQEPTATIAQDLGKALEG